MAILNSQRVTYITQNSFAYEKNKKKLQDSRLGIFLRESTCRNPNYFRFQTIFKMEVATNQQIHD